MKNNLNIFISAYTDFDEYPNNKTYKIVCGKGELKNSYNLDILEEDSKYTKLNKTMNEFTRIYYVYQSQVLPDYVGFCSYRRYFDFYDNIPDISQLMNNTDLLINPPLKLREQNRNVLQQYDRCHNIGDYYICRQIIQNVLNISETELISYEGILYTNNIFIMNSIEFCKFVEYISTVIDQYLKFMHFNTYDDIVNHIKNNKILYDKLSSTILYQSRLLGFLVERIGSVYINKHFKRIKYNNIILKNKDMYNKILKSQYKEQKR